MWASTTVLTPSSQTLTPLLTLYASAPHGEGPFLHPVKSRPHRPGLLFTFDRGQVGPKILLQPGALVLQREKMRTR